MTIDGCHVFITRFYVLAVELLVNEWEVRWSSTPFEARDASVHVFIN